jgi:hypothetical protein
MAVIGPHYRGQSSGPPGAIVCERLSLHKGKILNFGSPGRVVTKRIDLMNDQEVNRCH